MSTDEKVLKILEELQHGQKALQDDMSVVKAETAKIPAIEQRLDHHGTLLTGLTASMATVLEEQHNQRSDIRTLHTEVHASREEVKGEIEEVKAEVRAAREEAKRDTIDLKATIVKRFQSDERRITNIEEHEGIENPDKN
jgi:chromosome segregation ATPase